MYSSSLSEWLSICLQENGNAQTSNAQIFQTSVFMGSKMIKNAFSYKIPRSLLYLQAFHCNYKWKEDIFFYEVYSNPNTDRLRLGKEPRSFIFNQGFNKIKKVIKCTTLLGSSKLVPKRLDFFSYTKKLI